MKVLKVVPRGYCKGVVQAINAVKEARTNYSGNIYILGMIVHNSFVKEALEAYHIISLDTSKKSKEQYLEEINDGMVIFTAHGTSQKLIEKAQEKGLLYVDACCSDVTRTHDTIQSYEERGYTTLYIGKKNHPEAEAVLANFKNVHLVQNSDDVDNIPTSLTKIMITNQTTMSIHDVKKLMEYIVKKFPKAEYINEICDATRIRQEAVAALKDVNVLLVVGDPLSNNSNKLLQINTTIPKKHMIGSVSDIDINWFENDDVVAITSGASTPTYITNQVIEYMEQLDLNNPTTYPLPKVDISKIL